MSSGLYTLLPQSYLKKPQSNIEEAVRVRQFEQFGLLVKRVTCLYPTHTRIRVLSGVLAKLNHIPCEANLHACDRNVKYLLKCFGKMIHMFIAGWDDSEVMHLYELIERKE